MRALWRLAGRPTQPWGRHKSIGTPAMSMLLTIFGTLVSVAHAMGPGRIAELRQETVDMFYHGYDNYMNVAFPEDELRPISCVPLTRDREHPEHFELNDVLGNYSLTLIDSLSTLAILASAPADDFGTGKKALRDFQDGVEALTIQYGDGTDGPSGMGLRARGFDLDSKVQVFETVIRGVGGLLSAHLFAAGDLPIRGYKPKRVAYFEQKIPRREIYPPIEWPNGFKYDGQLLRLAKDLAERLLPAFFTNTGMPYPRVNLRYGVPFYQNSPLNQNSEGECRKDGSSEEVTETCSAGAGSLVLEFTVLSRLTGDPRFEQLAKRAFWSVWAKRSSIGLIGAGIDAERGHWIGHYAGIGAGADSFFEYALKTHILLSGTEAPNTTVPNFRQRSSFIDPDTLYIPLSDAENSAETFLHAWKDAHAAIKRHLYSKSIHPHYLNVNVFTGSPQAYWIDSLGAYYPGLLTLAGELDEAIETHLLYTALWTRYAALPERWSVSSKRVEGGLGWWPGRPEFVESTYHIYRATRDPWYLHVGEMVLEDINRRCWTKCGWSGLQDVQTGEKSDRMESFFLGETAKYLYLMYDPDHPLNSLDAPYIFTTEGHPLLIPRSPRTTKKPRGKTDRKDVGPLYTSQPGTCPVPPLLLPLSVSATAARGDLFHAASLIELELIPNLHAVEGTMPKRGDPIVSINDLHMFPNHTLYPRTLPTSLVPIDATCKRITTPPIFHIEFPANPQGPLASAGFNPTMQMQNLVRIENGILVKNLQGMKLALIEEKHEPPVETDGSVTAKSWRIWNIANTPLGRDEKVFVPRDVIGPIVDPIFTRVRQTLMFDLILQFETEIQVNETSTPPSSNSQNPNTNLDLDIDAADLSSLGLGAEYKTILSSLLQQVTSALRDPVATLLPRAQKSSFKYHFEQIEAISPTGVGAAPLGDWDEAPGVHANARVEKLEWGTAWFGEDGCSGRLEEESVYSQIIVLKRGGCSFNKKLANIPTLSSSTGALQIVLIVSEDEVDEFGVRPMIRPLLDEEQMTPSGLLRHNLVVMGMVGGGEETYKKLKMAKSVGVRRRYHVVSQGIPINNLIVV